MIIRKLTYIIIIISAIYSNELLALHNSVAYVSLSRQIALFNHVDVLSNNIANADTTSYKNKKLLYKSKDVDNGNRKKISYVHDAITVRNMQNGNMNFTGNIFDLAIDGDGFFEIKTPNGMKYTRNGKFHLNNQGKMVNNQAYTVQSASGDITFSKDTKEIIFHEDFSISTDGNILTQIKIVNINDKDIEESGESNFSIKNTNAVPIIAKNPDTRIIQGYLEGSNVNKVTELTELIQAQRNASLSSNMMSSFDEMERNTINRLGKLY